MNRETASTFKPLAADTKMRDGLRLSGLALDLIGRGVRAAAHRRDTETQAARRLTKIAVAIAMAAGTTEAGTAAATTITVTDGGDSGTISTCTLRQAIQAANSDSAVGSCAAGLTQNTIVFDPSLANSTITLTQGELAVTTGPTNTSRFLTITGSGQTIDAAGNSGVFRVYLTLFAGTPALSFYASNLTLTGGHATEGGGLYVGQYSYAGLTNCHITGNSAQYGAGIALGSPSNATIVNSVINNNTASDTAPNPNSFGGGIFVIDNSGITIQHSTIGGNNTGKGNTATYGAGMWVQNASAYIVDTTVSGNTASKGGGIGNAYSYLKLSNSTIYNNTATVNYGGLYVAASAATLSNVTVAGNQAAGKGSGVYAKGSSTTPNTIKLYNTIVANNLSTAAGHAAQDCSNDTYTTITAAYSLIGSTTAACGLVDGTNGMKVGSSPGLSPLASNGGSTQTLALAPTSPAIGAGSVALASFNGTPLNYDQRGFGYPRTFAGTIDMGAFQTQDSRIFADGFEPAPPEP